MGDIHSQLDRIKIDASHAICEVKAIPDATRTHLLSLCSELVKRLENITLQVSSIYAEIGVGEDDDDDDDEG